MINEQLDKSAGGLLTNNIVCLVVDNNDPERLKRIKIRAPFLHDGVPDSDLPWACPYDYAAWGNGSGDIMIIPKPGSEIICSFKNGINNPVYIGKIPTGNKRSALMNHDHYPNVYGFVDANGNEISFDEVAKLFKMVIDGDIQFEAGGDKSTIIIKGGNIEVQGGTVKISGTVAPTGAGPFCGLKNCLFSGAPHAGDTIQVGGA